MRYLFLMLSVLTPCLFLCSGCGTVLRLAQLGSKTYVVSNYDDIQKTPLHADGVYGRGLSDEDMFYLGRLKNIEVIDLCFNSQMELKLTDKGLENLAKVALTKLPKLRGVSICKSDLITDKGLYWISNIKQIKGVGISNCPQITNEGFRFLSSNSGITGIEANLEHIDNTALQYLKDMPNLESFVSRGLNFLDADSMRIISEFKKLNFLAFTLENSPNFNDLSLQELSKSQTIESLTIEVNENITPQGLVSLTKIKSLKYFHLGNCPTRLMNDDMFRQFHSSLPKCEILFEDSGYRTLYRYDPSGEIYIRPDLIPSAGVSRR